MRNKRINRRMRCAAIHSVSSKRENKNRNEVREKLT